jgi:hypothetical protein
MKQTLAKDIDPSYKLVGKFYLKRLFRLTPTSMLVMMFCVGLTRYFINGPFYPNDGLGPLNVSGCQQYFWTNLIYINNFKPFVSFVTR